MDRLTLQQTGITNFRDLGGWQTEDGYFVRRGCLYRSAPIQLKTPEARASFAKLGMRTILDLRSAQEQAALPDDVIPDCRCIRCSAIPEEGPEGGGLDLADMLKTATPAQLTEYVASIYRQLPFGNPAYRQLFDLLLAGETPLVFHCTAGKDRTGFAAWLILKTLGVSDADVMQDYLLSNVYRRDENERILKAFPKAKDAEGLLYVREAYLQSSIDAIRERYGSFEEYLSCEYDLSELNITLLKSRYLTPRA